MLPSKDAAINIKDALPNKDGPIWIEKGRDAATPVHLSTQAKSFLDIGQKEAVKVIAVWLGRN